MDTCNERSHIHKERCLFGGPGKMVETAMVDMIRGSTAKNFNSVRCSTINAQPGENGVPWYCPRHLDEDWVLRGLRLNGGTELNSEGDKLVLETGEWRPFLVVSDLSNYVLLLPRVQTRQIRAPSASGPSVGRVSES